MYSQQNHLNTFIEKRQNVYNNLIEDLDIRDCLIKLLKSHTVIFSLFKEINSITLHQKTSQFLDIDIYRIEERIKRLFLNIEYKNSTFKLFSPTKQLFVLFNKKNPKAGIISTIQQLEDIAVSIYQYIDVLELELVATVSQSDSIDSQETNRTIDIIDEYLAFLQKEIKDYVRVLNSI